MRKIGIILGMLRGLDSFLLSCLLILPLGFTRADDSDWPSVGPEYYDVRGDSGFQVKGPYFRGGFISAADDVGAVGTNRFLLRRTFTLKAKPVEAHLQGIGDAQATFRLNGTEVATSSFSLDYGWVENKSFDVSVADALKTGANELTVDYSYWSEIRWGGALRHNFAGGAVAELAVRYPDGAWERICLDGETCSSSDGREWKGVAVGPVPPAPPHLVRLKYVDYVTPQVPRTEMKMLAGLPQVFVNDEPLPVLWGAVRENARPDGLPKHSQMPLTVVKVTNNYKTWHPKAGVYDFSSFDSQAAKYLAEYPDAWLMWDFTVYPPDDFRERFPGEMSAEEDGDTSALQRFSYSYASRKAMAEMREMVGKAIRHVEASAYAHRVIGYRVCSGVTIEWLGWQSRRGHCRDFSAPNRKRFAEFAAVHYPELVDPHVPTPAERGARDADADLLWDRAKHLNAIAYNDYDSWIIAEDALELCGHAKDTLKALGRTKLVGTYYGYTFHLNGSGNDVWRGHFALKRLLDGNNGRIDYLMSPQCYGQQRNFGETFGEMKPFATIQKAGVMPIIEDDTRTANRWHPFYGAQNTCPTLWHSEQQIRRNGAFNVCRGVGSYFYALTTGLEFNSPGLASVGTNVLAATRRALACGVGRHAEVALVVSEKTIVSSPPFGRKGRTGEKVRKYVADGTVAVEEQCLAYLNGEIGHAVQSKFSRSGAPVDLLLAEDLDRHPGDYRLYVFLNLFTYDEGTLAAVRLLQARGATCLWTYAPGFMKDGSLASMRELTGIAFEKGPGPADCGVVMKEDGRWMGMPDAQVAQGFVPLEPAEVLGTTKDGRPALTRHAVGASTAYYSATWQLDMKFIKDLVRASGAFVFTDGDDPMEANDAFFALHARRAGTKTVRLPHKAHRIVDCFSGRQVAADTDTFAFDAKLHESFLFYFGN